jgi:hypothetical protein
VGGWPDNLRVQAGIGIFSIYEKLQKYDYDGSLVWAINVPGAMDFSVANDGGIWLQENRNKYLKYSAEGQLLRTYTSRPLALGVNKSSQKQTDGSYLTVIEYDDSTFSVTAPTKLGYFTRDISRNLLAVIRVGSVGHMHSRVYKYNTCSKVLGSVDLPEDNIVEEPDTIPPRPTPLLTVVAEYGQPVIAPNGDIYVSKISPDNYSILKWTWVDDPNAPSGPDAPTGFSLMPSTTGLYLTWTASAQDPGCVTRYEVSRATTSGGIGSTVATVNAGVVKYNDTTAEVGTTYYYKVRAVSGSDYSPYSRAASGKR